ncbi:MAG TPA: NAD(P)/FAD-dependent oxidoreductase, partial [Acidimicrobiia bacterium]|nr:NAD(P)/FAD-dependent oxidoreductase [Acidimicrobiia bacterium]
MTIRDDDQLRAALETAHIPTLLMVLAHYTGDDRWLQPPYTPERGRGLDANDSGGLPPEIQADIRHNTFAVIRDWRDGRIGDPPAPSSDELIRMLSVCLGEPVSPEYSTMMLEEMGVLRREAEWTSATGAALSDFNVIVIGAGLSGICAAIKLKQAGIAFTVFDKNPSLGGTWFENRYPGCRVDTPSHLYSFSFAPNHDWSNYYARQPDIHEYLVRCAIEYRVVNDIRFSAEVTSAIFDDDSGRWTVTVRRADGTEERHEANAVISAVGQLNRPAVPKIAGADSFTGRAFHTARWPDDVDVTGKRVAVLGTGASAMQVVPSIAGDVESLTIFQRSPQWAAPNPNYLREVSDEAKVLFNELPYFAEFYRVQLVWRFNDLIHKSLQIDPNWRDPRSINEVNEGHRKYLTRYIEQELGERTDLRDVAIPDYPPYGKRMLMDNGWFRTITRPNVRVVTDRIERIEPDGLRTADGEHHPLDVIVYATGFDAHHMLAGVDVRGRAGRSLRDEWGDDDPRAYLGMTVPGFPNLFLLYGPNTNLGHGGTIIFHAECQVRYVVSMLITMIESSIRSIEVRQDVCDEYNRRVDEAHCKMVWTHPAMETWYRNARGRVVTNSPWRLIDYWKMTREVNLTDYDLESMADEAPKEAV